MPNGQHVAFLTAVVVTGLILHFFPYDKSKLAALRLERLWGTNISSLRSQIRSQCGSLVSLNSTRFERRFLSWFALENDPSKKPCQIEIHSKHSEKFYLSQMWVFALRLIPADNQPVIKKTFKLTTPKPLVILPFAIFLLALLFDVSLWGFGLTVASYLFLLGGANLIHSFNVWAKSFLLTAITEESLWGIALIVLWISLLQSRVRNQVTGQVEKNGFEKISNRLFQSIIGLWNPLIFTLFGSLTVPLRKRRILSFLNIQLLLTALSLYLLSFGFGTFGESLKDSLLMPRYFTYGLLLFLLLELSSRPISNERLLWGYPKMWRAPVAIGLMEGVRFFVPELNSLNTLTRIGLALVLSELFWIASLSSSFTIKKAMPWLGALGLGFFLSVVAFETGIGDLVLVIWDPRTHPRAVTLFTFLAGISLGCLTGSLSTAFFALFAFMKSPQLPLLKAALIDGILVGSLLSPFSLFNLLPAVQFKMDMRKIFLMRIRQMGIPLSIACLTYAIATFNSVSILRPITFVFACLLAIAIQLQKNGWSLRRPLSGTAS